MDDNHGVLVEETSEDDYKSEVTRDNVKHSFALAHDIERTGELEEALTCNSHNDVA